MNLKPATRFQFVALSIGRARDPRQRRVEMLWVKACGGEVFQDAAGSRYAVFDPTTKPPRALLLRCATRLLDIVPIEWTRLG